jgi:hypothetical protein
MDTQKIIDRLERIKPGLENSNSAAEDAMVEILPSVIEALGRLADQEKPIVAGAITGFYQASASCGDCVDGWCQMNCGPAVTS